MGQVVGKTRVEVRNEVDLLQKPSVSSEFAGECVRSVGAVQSLVVVVDEVPEQSILPMRQRTESYGDAQKAREVGQGRVIDRQGFRHLEAQDRAHHDDGMAEQECEV